MGFDQYGLHTTHCTRLDREARQTLSAYASCWALEPSFQDMVTTLRRLRWLEKIEAASAADDPRGNLAFALAELAARVG